MTSNTKFCPLKFSGRPFVKQFALCYRSVVCLSCPVCMSCLWRSCTVAKRLDGSKWNLETWHTGRPRPWPHCIIIIIQHLYSALKSCKGYGGAEKTTPCGKTLKISFRKDSPPSTSTICVQISWNLADRKSVKWCVIYVTKWWGPSSPPPKGHSPSIFGPYLLQPNGCMDQDVTWYGARSRPRRHCITWGPRRSSPKGGGAEASAQRTLC